MKKWVVPDKCYIKPRGNKFQAFYMIESTGNYKRETTGESDFAKAKEVALARYMEVYDLEKRGMPVRDKGSLVVTFNDVTKLQRAFWIHELNAGTGKVVFKSYIEIIDNWLLPYFQDTPLPEVDDDKIFEFEQHRKRAMGRDPAKSTINSHNCVFRAIFETAVRKKYTLSSGVPRFTVKNKGAKPKPRASFTTKEIQELEGKLFVWRQGHVRATSRYQARTLYYYVKLLVACGIRTGKEIDSIQWKHVNEDYFNEANGLHYIRIDLPHRKTERPWSDDHVLVSQDLTETCFEGLRDHTRRTDPDDYLFCDIDAGKPKSCSGRFRAFLEEAGYRYLNDDSNKGRALYSLRHYYATQRITKEKVSREVLSKHMATGIAMLEKYYVDAESAEDAELLAPSMPAVQRPVDFDDPLNAASTGSQIDQIMASNLSAEMKLNAIEAIRKTVGI